MFTSFFVLHNCNINSGSLDCHEQERLEQSCCSVFRCFNIRLLECFPVIFIILTDDISCLSLTMLAPTVVSSSVCQVPIFHRNDFLA
jgi:hypothetical protein